MNDLHISNLGHVTVPRRHIHLEYQCCPIVTPTHHGRPPLNSKRSRRHNRSQQHRTLQPAQTSQLPPNTRSIRRPHTLRPLLGILPHIHSRRQGERTAASRSRRWLHQLAERSTAAAWCISEARNQDVDAGAVLEWEGGRGAEEEG